MKELKFAVIGAITALGGVFLCWALHEANKQQKALGCADSECEDDTDEIEVGDLDAE